MNHWPLLMLFVIACGGGGGPLPAAENAAALDEADAATPPPLYQLLYDSALLPEVQEVEQRTRILIWLRHVDLDVHQLEMLRALHHRADELRHRVVRAQGEILERFEPSLLPTYLEVWDILRAGADLDDPRLVGLAEGMEEARQRASREKEILALRMQSVRALLDEEQELLRSLGPEQEIRFADVAFVLRGTLDQAATPGDFRALLGTLFSVGDPTILLRGDYSLDRKPLAIGALWSDEAVEDLSAPVLHEARKELLLYLLLQEPALEPAIDGALVALEHRRVQASGE